MTPRKLVPMRLAGAASGGVNCISLMARPYRRSDFDVTDTVQVSSPPAVRKAVLQLYSDTWPGAPLETLSTALTDFERLFTGQTPGYLGVDTVYHDLQHSQDVVLAMTRLMAGYEKSHADGPRIGAAIEVEIEDAADALDVHGEAFKPIGDFARNRIAIKAADLLEVGELRHFHAVAPDFPA